MEIFNVVRQTEVTPQNLPKPSSEVTAEKTKSTLAADNADKFVKSEETFTPAYTKKFVQKKNVEMSRNGSAGAAADSKADYAQVVEKIISHLHTNTCDNSGTTITIRPELLTDMQKSDEQQESSQSDYWSADSAAKRIIDYAEYIVGTDSTKADFSRKAFVVGFSMAELDFGGKNSLSEVCYQTFEKAMRLFDEWENRK